MTSFELSGDSEVQVILLYLVSRQTRFRPRTADLARDTSNQLKLSQSSHCGLATLEMDTRWSRLSTSYSWRIPLCSRDVKRFGLIISIVAAIKAR